MVDESLDEEKFAGGEALDGLAVGGPVDGLDGCVRPIGVFV